MPFNRITSKQAATADTLAIHGVEVAHYFGGGAYAKEVRIPAGAQVHQHIHPHAHLSILASGRVVVTADGERTEFAGPACLEIQAGVAHAIEALTDAVWYCIHATDDEDPATVDTSILTGKNV